MAIGTPVLLGIKNNSGASPTQIVTSGPTPSGALLIWVASLWTSGSDTSLTVTTTGGLTWTTDAEKVTGNYAIFFCSAPAPSGLASSTTIAVTPGSFPAGANYTLLYVEGVDQSASRVDGAGAVGNSGTSNLWNTGAASTTVTDSILICGAFGDGMTISTMTTTAPATELSGSEQLDTGNEWSSSVSYWIVSSAGSYTLDGTFGEIADFGRPAAWLAYKADTGAAAPGPSRTFTPIPFMRGPQ